MSLLDLIQKGGVKGDMDFLREGIKVLAEAGSYRLDLANWGSPIGR